MAARQQNFAHYFKILICQAQAATAIKWPDSIWVSKAVCVLSLLYKNEYNNLCSTERRDSAKPVPIFYSQKTQSNFNDFKQQGFMCTLATLQLTSSTLLVCVLPYPSNSSDNV